MKSILKSITYRQQSIRKQLTIQSTTDHSRYFSIILVLEQAPRPRSYRNSSENFNTISF